MLQTLPSWADNTGQSLMLCVGGANQGMRHAHAVVVLVEKHTSTHVYQPTYINPRIHHSVTQHGSSDGAAQHVAGAGAEPGCASQI